MSWLNNILAVLQKTVEQAKSTAQELMKELKQLISPSSDDDDDWAV